MYIAPFQYNVEYVPHVLCDMAKPRNTINRTSSCMQVLIIILLKITRKNVGRKEHLHRNQNETLLRPGSASLAVRLRMLESEERGRAKAVSGRDELAEENHRKK